MNKRKKWLLPIGLISIVISIILACSGSPDSTSHFFKGMFFGIGISTLLGYTVLYIQYKKNQEKPS